MKKLVIMLAVAVLAAAMPVLAQTSVDDRVPPKDMRDQPKTGVRGNAGEGVGTVQYDPGAPADGFLVGASGSNYDDYFGNLFDTRNGAPLSPGTITGVSWYQGAIGSPYAVVVNGAPGATLTYFFVTGVSTSNTFFNVPAAIAAPSPRIVGLGLYNSFYGAEYFGSMGLRSASTNNMGFHGIQRSFFPGDTNTLPGQNAMFRVSGTIIVPVELMEFDID